MMYILLKAVPASLFQTTVPVEGYTRKTGVYVQPHQAARKKKLEPTTAPHSEAYRAILQELWWIKFHLQSAILGWQIRHQQDEPEQTP